MDVDDEFTPGIVKRDASQLFENEDIDEEEDEEEDGESEEEDQDTLGEYDDYEDSEYGLYGAVQVTDIIVDESDDDYIPSKDW